MANADDTPLTLEAAARELFGGEVTPRALREAGRRGKLRVDRKSVV